jgi:hypothetical protein
MSWELLQIIKVVGTCKTTRCICIYTFLWQIPHTASVRYFGWVEIVKIHRRKKSLFWSYLLRNDMMSQATPWGHHPGSERGEGLCTRPSLNALRQKTQRETKVMTSMMVMVKGDSCAHRPWSTEPWRAMKHRDLLMKGARREWHGNVQGRMRLSLGATSERGGGHECPLADRAIVGSNIQNWEGDESVPGKKELPV